MSETGTTYGSWKYIGYTMASNTVFTYAEGTLTAGSATTATIPATAAEVWSATPVAALNDCASTGTNAGYWKIKIKTAATGNGAGYKANVKGANCNVLAPSFGKLDETGAATID